MLNKLASGGCAQLSRPQLGVLEDVEVRCLPWGCPASWPPHTPTHPPNCVALPECQLPAAYPFSCDLLACRTFWFVALYTMCPGLAGQQAARKPEWPSTQPTHHHP